MSEAEQTEPTPDELLLELMDLVALAFPEPLHSMTITFQKNEDGRRPALTNLDGKAHPGQPQKPDLGHGDNVVLDAINSLLTDFMDATFRQGRVRVLDGRIEVSTGNDGERNVRLMDQDGLVMSRRFDRSELRWLFWTGPLFEKLNATAADEAEQRRRVHEAVASYRKFDIDMARGTIAFSSPDKPSQSWSFELLGSWSDDTKNFLWGWGNDEVPHALRKRVEKIRAASTDEGLRALTEATFGCPERCAERLCAHVAARIGAFGVYRAKFSASQGAGFMYLALLPSA